MDYPKTEHRLTEIWRSVLSELEKILSKPSFETWLKATKPLDLRENTLIVEVPNEFTKEWLESHYRKNISHTIQKVSNCNYNFHFVTPQKIDPARTKPNSSGSGNRGEEKNTSPASAEGKAQGEKNRKSDLSGLCNWLNPKYTFDSFVIGGSNRLAHAASLAVAEAPSKAYNPLFIYGGVGLGKTHLMHAIGHFVISNNTSNNTAYLSTEKFTNQFINAIRDNRTLEFRNKYRNIDVLLIDDIQFLAGKEQTQEEFFHTFNALHENNKQIVISSDRPPKEIPTLEDRLRSRFEWGLITDIHPPNLETRIAILRKKSSQDGTYIPDDVLLYIAQKVEKNIRELEGALIRIMAYASLEDKLITLQLAQEALKDFFSERQKPSINPEQIISATSSYFKITPEDIRSKKRASSISLPRQIAMYLVREMTAYSLPRIGQEFGGKDHTTVIHAHRKISVQNQTNGDLQQHIKGIKELLKNHL